jgi:hypothetical protein
VALTFLYRPPRRTLVDVDNVAGEDNTNRRESAAHLAALSHEDHDVVVRCRHE